MKKTVPNAKIEWDEKGNLFSTEFNDPYFSLDGGLQETRYVFLQNNDLSGRWQKRWQRSEPAPFVIAESGFGSGLNFLACRQLFDQFISQNPAQYKDAKLHFISFEKFPVSPDDLEKAHQYWPELEPYAKALQAQYPLPVSGCHRLHFDNVTLDLWFGDINEILPTLCNQPTGIVDAWFLDGFAPSKNPQMWQEMLFEQMARLTKTGGTFATFTAAGIVRRGLQAQGFNVKKVPGFGTKREMLTGILDERGSTVDETSAPYSQALPETVKSAQHSSSDTDAHIAIIGGGIASATLCYQLTQKGYRVTLYCKDATVAQEASGNTQGAIYPLLSAENDLFFIPALEQTLNLIKELEEKGFKTHFHPCGVLQLSDNEAQYKKAQAILNKAFPDQLVRGLNADETDKVSGVQLNLPSLYYPGAGWINAAAFTQTLINAAMQTGHLILRYDHQLSQLNYQDNLWQLQFGNQKSGYHPSVILACGADVTQFEQTATLPLTKVRGQVSHIPSQGMLTQLKSVLCYKGYLTPASDGEPATHHLGASYVRGSESRVFEPEEQQENLSKLQISLGEKNPLCQSVDISANRGRAAVRCSSRDHLPFIGVVSASTPSLYIVGALGSRGLTSATLCSEVLCALMLGEPQPIDQSLLKKLLATRLSKS